MTHRDSSGRTSGRLGTLTGRTWKARRCRQFQRRSLFERLAPRVVLNAVPVAVPDPWYSTNLNTALTVTTQGTTLLANDLDAEGHTLSASLVTNPSHGTLSNFGSNGTLTYTPSAGYTGFDHFTYRADDGSDTSKVVEATIAVGGYMGPRTNQDGPGQDLALLAGSLELVEPIITVVSSGASTATFVSEGTCVPAAMWTGSTG